MYAHYRRFFCYSAAIVAVAFGLTAALEAINCKVNLSTWWTRPLSCRALDTGNPQVVEVTLKINKEDPRLSFTSCSREVQDLLVATKPSKKSSRAFRHRYSLVLYGKAFRSPSINDKKSIGAQFVALESIKTHIVMPWKATGLTLMNILAGTQSTSHNQRLHSFLERTFEVPVTLNLIPTNIKDWTFDTASIYGTVSQLDINQSAMIVCFDSFFFVDIPLPFPTNYITFPRCAVHSPLTSRDPLAYAWFPNNQLSLLRGFLIQRK